MNKKFKCVKCKSIDEVFYVKSYNLKICKHCFLDFFRKRVKEAIEKFNMFSLNDKVAVAISGGKDSVALARVLKDLGYNITLFHINVGIKKDDYSEKCQKVVKTLAEQEHLPLKIISLAEEIGVDIKTVSKAMKKEICSVCGMVKRYILNREAKDFDVVVTGHNLNDEASLLLKSFMFWQDESIRRQYPLLAEYGSLKRKAKPLIFCYESDTKLFCDVLNLPYYSQPCPFRGKSYVVFKKNNTEIGKRNAVMQLNIL